MRPWWETIHLFPNNIVLGVEIRWSVRHYEGWESFKSASSSRQELIFLVTFAYSTEGGDGDARALLDVNHIASNELCDLAWLGCILYLELTYLWR